jgi:hypothetical protein
VLSHGTVDIGLSHAGLRFLHSVVCRSSIQMTCCSGCEPDESQFLAEPVEVGVVHETARVTNYLVEAPAVMAERLASG